MKSVEILFDFGGKKLIFHNFLNNGPIFKIQSPAETTKRGYFC